MFHNIKGKAAFVLTAFLAVAVAAIEGIVPSRWMDPQGRAKPIHTSPPKGGKFQISKAEPAAATEIPPPALTNCICLVVADGLYDSVSNKLARHVQDLQKAGYTVSTYRFVSGTAESLRSYLAGLYTGAGSLVGVELIGALPYVIYEMMQDWGSGSEYDDFPCDVFYMDLDGTWSDVLENGSVHAGNGKYDTWTGNTSLEIWVSRLKTDNLSDLGAEATVMNNYFEKNHRYRQHTLTALWRSLVYDDDDWSYMGTSDAAYMSRVYAATNVLMVTNIETTTAADYKSNRLSLDQEFLFTRSHGYTGGHGYYRSSRTVFDYVYSSDYRVIDPKALFYSLFICSGSDYTANNYLAGIIVFNDPSGLLAWGSTKTGGMFSDDLFYYWLQNGASFGKAFVNWFNYVRPLYSVAPQWWYGMVMVGDASLRPASKTFVLSLSLPGSAREGNGTLVDQGVVSIPWTLESDLVILLASSDSSELSVPASVTVSAGSTTVPFNVGIVDDVEQDGTQSITVTASCDAWASASAAMNILDNDFRLTVISANGMASPPAGQYICADGTNLTCSITNSPAALTDSQSMITCVCTGWTGTGSVPASGAGTNTSFTITANSSITWGWVITDIVVSNQAVTTVTNLQARDTITARDGYQVQSPGNVNLQAGKTIRLQSGFTVRTGAVFRAGITAP